MAKDVSDSEPILYVWLVYRRATTLNLELVSVRDSFDADSNGKMSLSTEEGQRLVRIPIDELQQANADKE